MGKWVVGPTGSRAQGPAAPCVPGGCKPTAGQRCRGCKPLGFAGREVPASRPCPAVGWPKRESPSLDLSTGRQTQSSPGETPRTRQLHRPVFLFCLLHSTLSQPSWLCPERVGVLCKASPPTFSPPSEAVQTAETVPWRETQML